MDIQLREAGLYFKEVNREAVLLDVTQICLELVGSLVVTELKMGSTFDGSAERLR